MFYLDILLLTPVFQPDFELGYSVRTRLTHFNRVVLTLIVIHIFCFTQVNKKNIEISLKMNSVTRLTLGYNPLTELSNTGLLFTPPYKGGKITEWLVG